MALFLLLISVQQHTALKIHLHANRGVFRVTYIHLVPIDLRQAEERQ